MKEIVDDVLVLYVTPGFGSIGSFYLRFDQVSDDEVIELLQSKRAGVPN
jgi:predicted phosphoribosyltransferase